MVMRKAPSSFLVQTREEARKFASSPQTVEYRISSLLDTHFPSRAYTRRRTLDGTNVIPTWRDFPNLSDSTLARFGRVALHPTPGVGLSEGEHARDTRAWFGSYSLDPRSPRACRKPIPKTACGMWHVAWRHRCGQEERRGELLSVRSTTAAVG